MYYYMLIPGAGPGLSSFSRVSRCAHIAHPYSRQIISEETQKTGIPIILACNDVRVTTTETLKFPFGVEERARASCECNEGKSQFVYYIRCMICKHTQWSSVACSAAACHTAQCK